VAGLTAGPHQSAVSRSAGGGTQPAGDSAQVDVLSVHEENHDL